MDGIDSALMDGLGGLDAVEGALDGNLLQWAEGRAIQAAGQRLAAQPPAGAPGDWGGPWPGAGAPPGSPGTPGGGWAPPTGPPAPQGAPGRRMLRAAARQSRAALRKGTARSGHGALAWLVLAVLGAADAAAHLHGTALPVASSGSLLAAVLAAFAWRRTAGWKPRRRTPARVWACASAVTLAGWLAWAALAASPRTGAEALIPLWLGCYLPWWDRYRPRHRHGRQEPQPAAEVPRDVLLERLRERVCGKGGTLAGAEVHPGPPMKGGRSFLLRGIPGKHTVSLFTSHAALVASAAEVPRARVVIEPVAGDSPGEQGPENLARLTVLGATSVLHEIQEFTGPTYDPATGHFTVGAYPDGSPCPGRLLKVDEHGSPIRAASGLTAGTTGSGKSRYAEHKGMEHLASGLFQVVLLDGQGGASIPGLIDYVGWAALTPEEWRRALRALVHLMVARTRLIASRRMPHWDPALGPFVQVPIEEAHKPLLDPVNLRCTKALLQEGEKAGIGVDLSTQFPSVVELGGAAGTTGANVLRDLAASGNVTVFRTGSEFAAKVMVGSTEVASRDLPRRPGMCYALGASMRAVPVRAIRAADPAAWSHLFTSPAFTPFDVAALDTEDRAYSTRLDRLAARCEDGEAPDTSGAAEEAALIFGEATAGQPSTKPGKRTCVQAVWEHVRDHGPARRAGIIAAVGYSASAVDNALQVLEGQGGIRGTGTHGEYECAKPVAVAR